MTNTAASSTRRTSRRSETPAHHLKKLLLLIFATGSPANSRYGVRLALIGEAGYSTIRRLGSGLERCSFPPDLARRGVQLSSPVGTGLRSCIGLRPIPDTDRFVLFYWSNIEGRWPTFGNPGRMKLMLESAHEIVESDPMFRIPRGR